MIRAYYFLQADMTARSGDERQWEIGEHRTIADPSEIALCEYGYHSSPSLWDALACFGLVLALTLAAPWVVHNWPASSDTMLADTLLAPLSPITEPLRMARDAMR
jgi:hypothetical protein